MGIDPSGLWTMSELLSSFSVVILLNTLVGGAIGGIQNGARGVVAGAAGSFTSSTIGFVLGGALGLGLGFFGWGLGMGFGSSMGALVELDILEGLENVSVIDIFIQLAVSFIIGGVLGAITQGQSAFVAKAFLKKLGGVRALRPAMLRTAVGSGTLTKGFVEFTEYYLAHPWELKKIMLRYITPEFFSLLWGSFKGSIELIMGGTIGWGGS